MLIHVTKWLLLVPVAVMAVDDFRRREVGVVWLVVFALAASAVGVMAHGVAGAAINVAGNMMVLLYLAGGILLYIRLRRGRWRWKESAGGGDVVFLAGATPLLELREYVVFLIGAGIVSLLWWAVVRAETIPFVATGGIVFMISIWL